MLVLLMLFYEKNNINRGPNHVFLNISYWNMIRSRPSKVYTNIL